MGSTTLINKPWFINPGLTLLGKIRIHKGIPFNRPIERDDAICAAVDTLQKCKGCNAELDWKEHLWKGWRSQHEHEHDCQRANNGTSFKSNEPVAVCPSIRWQDLKAKADCITSWGFQDTNSTAQGGGGSFKNRKPIVDGRANPLMDRKVLEVSCLTSCWCVVSKPWTRYVTNQRKGWSTNRTVTLWQTMEVLSDKLTSGCLTSYLSALVTGKTNSCATSSFITSCRCVVSNSWTCYVISQRATAWQAMGWLRHKQNSHCVTNYAGTIWQTN